MPVIAENTDGEAYGMTLSDYMRTMKTETWGAPGRPQSGASATMAVEDCIPPDNASLLSDFSGCSFVDPEEVLSDLEYSNLDREGNAVLSYSSESEDPMPREGVWDLNSNRHTFSQAAGLFVQASKKRSCIHICACVRFSACRLGHAARGLTLLTAENGLDLRPATAAVGQTHTLQHDIKEDKAADTRQVDLASLPASLFYPRSEEDRARRPSGGFPPRARLSIHLFPLDLLLV